MTILQLKKALEQCVAVGRCEFMTYGAFSERFRLGNYAPAWANRKVLDAVAQEFRAASTLDLTFLLRNGKTGYPSVISGRPSNPANPQQAVRAKAVAQQIINTYAPGTPNPYLAR